ncbi:MAG: hypothetical protein JRM78_01910 [Nitrososphaerota archaeon]|nr:hypothetical protein [Nitrososphaerota archaeon]MDG7040947.1 hypothetical protein [Nitrososphaerota archaeon]MDG7042648.1 hypothetical protein [Nitrososphaerota archaeon]MDG7048336.1 hypothetical protein [Nitrososphaerota archaeon]
MRIAILFGTIAVLIDLFVGISALVVTGGFSRLSFLLVAFYDASPMLMAGIGVFAGLMIAIKKSNAKRGGLVVLITGLLPVLVLYDIVHTVVAYGSTYISFPLAIIFILLLVIPMILSSISGTLIMRSQRNV